MKVRCIYNSGKDLVVYSKNSLFFNELSEFGCTSQTNFGLTLGKEYLVLGMLIGEGGLNYLLDDAGSILAYPYLLFEVIDDKLPSNWFFKSFSNASEYYPYRKAVWGYYELVYDELHYEKLIEGNKDAQLIYYKRKVELENL